jgi:hypothetical protein
MQLKFPVYLWQLRSSVGTLLITKLIDRICRCSPIGVLSCSSNKIKSQKCKSNDTQWDGDANTSLSSGRKTGSGVGFDAGVLVGDVGLVLGVELEEALGVGLDVEPELEAELEIELEEVVERSEA